MKYTLKELTNALGLTDMPEAFGAEYEKDAAEFESLGASFLSDTFIDKMQDEYGVFSSKYSFVKNSANAVRENELTAYYSFLLSKMLKRRKRGVYIKLTCAGNGNDIALEMAPFFALLSVLPESVERLCKKGLSEEMIKDSVIRSYEASVCASSDTLGRDGFDVITYFSWNQRLIDGKIFRVGVFNFEMKDKFSNDAVILENRKGELRFLTSCMAEFTETDTYYEGYEINTQTCELFSEKCLLSKNEWNLAISPDAPVVSVHIPKNADLSPESMESSYRSCIELYKKYFPEFKPQAFVCFSWMMDPQLKKLLNPGSKILGFQSRYMLFPRADGGKGVFKFIFNKPAGVDVGPLEALPDGTSLQRAVKQHYIDGNLIYAQGGIFFIDSDKKYE